MKSLLITLFVLLAAPVVAQNIESSTALDVQRTVLLDLLSEDHISQMDYDRQMAALENQTLILKSQHTAQLPTLSGPAGTASVSGTVQVGGLNQAGVEIYLYETVTRQFSGAATTDALGAYTIPDLAAGNYYLLANGYNDDYIDAMWSSTGSEQCYSCQPDVDNTIVLSDAEVRTSVDMTLEVGASISGQVTSSGVAVDMMFVTVRPENNQGFYGSASTDVLGNYSIRGLPADDYYLLANNDRDDYIDAQWTPAGTEPCVNCQLDPANLINLMVADVLVGYDFAVTEGATLTGQITDGTTLAAVETLRVELYDPVGMTTGYFWTQFDGIGNYTLSGVPQGDYKVYLSPNFVDPNEYVPEIYNNIPCNLCANMVYNGAGDLVSLTNGMTTSGIDFALDKGASISGAVLNAAHLPETMEETVAVYLFNASNRFIAIARLNGTNYDPAFNGTYKIGGLLPGTYFVQGGDFGREFFQRELYNDIRCPWSGCNRGGGGDPVTLGVNEQRIGINFLLEYGGKISGTVTDDATGLPIVSEVPIYIQFYDASGQVAGGAGVYSDGTYTTQRALPPGTYSVRTGSMFFGGFSEPYVMEKYDPAGNIDCPGVTCDLTLGNVVVPAYVRQMPRDPVAEAAAATITGIDFALSPAFSFSGTITELGSSTPLPDVHVLVYNDNGDFANWATTDAAGDFTVSGLPAGTYYALTNNGSNLPFLGYFPETVGSWIDILFNGMPCPGSTCDVTTGDPIVLGGAPGINGAGGGPILDFSLSTGGTITGQVNTFGSALPAQYVDVNVYNSAGVFYGSYPSDDSGYYLTAGLPDDTYYLTTSNDGALIDAKYGGDYCFNSNCDPLDAVPVVITGGLSLSGIDFDLRTDYVFKNGMD